jgi:hypothetical protein
VSDDKKQSNKRGAQGGRAGSAGPETCEGDECLISSAALARLHVYIYQPALSCVTLSLSFKLPSIFYISSLLYTLLPGEKLFFFFSHPAHTTRNRS